MVTFTGLFVPTPVQVAAGRSGLLSRMSPVAAGFQEVVRVLPDLEKLRVMPTPTAGVTSPLVVITPPLLPAW